MHDRGPGKIWNAHMQNMDTSKDGKISRGEWTRYHQDKFDAADTGKDGSIDDKEMQAYHELMMKDIMGARKKRRRCVHCRG